MKRQTALHLIAATAILNFNASAGTLPETSTAGWWVARSPNFQVYSQAGPERAKVTLQRFEQLRKFFKLNRVIRMPAASEQKAPVRVLEFRTAKQYQQFQLRPTADAYYSATNDRDYIVMPISAINSRGVAAHEYAHFALRSGGLKLPPWLGEGLSELSSTATITSAGCELGGAIPVHVETLRRVPWWPASELFALDPIGRNTRNGASAFYAQSWALTDMLVSSPNYAQGFTDLVQMLNIGIPTSQAISNIYGKTSAQVIVEAGEWLRHGASPRQKLPPLEPGSLALSAEPVPESEAQALLADLLITNEDWNRAEQMITTLLRSAPNNPDLLASLGTIALGKHQPEQAIEYWREAVSAGLADAFLCYRYAQLADRMDATLSQIEVALEHAVKLRPDFDDAQFKLAQLKSNQGDYASAVDHLQAMTRIPPQRAFGYWTALAYAQTELGSRKEAEASAEQAGHFASTAAERARAAQLAYAAKTQLGVQFTRDSRGNLQLSTTRIPFGSTAVNPFIEAEDQMTVASGHLEEVQCHEGKLTGMLLKNSSGTLTLSIADPSHIYLRNTPSEWMCGPQTGIDLVVEYATTANPNHGQLRGMSIKK